MKVEKTVKVLISENEYEELMRARDILKNICSIFDEINKCEVCPFYSVCGQLPNTLVPYSIIEDCVYELEIDEDSAEIDEI